MTSPAKYAVSPGGAGRARARTRTPHPPGDDDMPPSTTRVASDARCLSGFAALRACADDWLGRRRGSALASLVCLAAHRPAAGDGCPAADAARLETLMRRLHERAAGAGIAARDGDDQLVLFLPGPPTMNHAEHVTQRLLRAVPAEGPGVVAGIAHGPVHGTDFETLLARARHALGEAQLEGDRDYRIYHPE